jgi:hypothetical protein
MTISQKSHLAANAWAVPLESGDVSERGLGAAFFPAGDARLLEVEFVLHASARFIGDLAVAQWSVDEFALNGDQLGAELCGDRSGVEPVGHILRQPADAIVVTGAQARQDLGLNSAVGRQQQSLADERFLATDRFGPVAC